MDAITQALPVFTDLASTLLPVEEADAQGGSLFGALVAAFAKSDVPLAEGTTELADAASQQVVALGSSPPPVLARQWLAQLSSLPALPPGLDAERPHDLPFDEPRTLAPSSDFAPLEAEPAFDPSVGFIFPEAEFPTALTASLPAVETVTLTPEQVSSNEDSSTPEPAPSNTTPLSANVEAVSATPEAIVAPTFGPQITESAPEEVPSVPASAVQQTKATPDDDANVSVTYDKTKHAHVGVATAEADYPPVKIGSRVDADAAVGQLLTPFFAEPSTTPAVHATGTTNDDDATIDAVSQRPQSSANSARPTFEPLGTIPLEVDDDAAQHPNTAPPDAAGLDVAAKASSGRAAPMPQVNIAAVNHTAVNFLLAQEAEFKFEVPKSNGRGPAAKSESTAPTPEVRVTSLRPEATNVQSAEGGPTPEMTPAKAVAVPTSDNAPETANANKRSETKPAPAQPVVRNDSNANPPPSGAVPVLTSLSPNNAQLSAPQPMAPETVQAVSFAAPMAAGDFSSVRGGDDKIAPALALTPRDSFDLPIDGLALRIAARSMGNDNRFTIRLDPPELGHIEVTLNVSSQGHAQAALVVEKAQTLDLLQRDAPALERALKDAGLDLSSDLSFSLKGEGASQFWRDEQSAPRYRNLEFVEAANANAAIVGASAAATSHYGAGSSRLDITV